MAAMKYERDDFRDQAKGIVRKLKPRRTQRTMQRRMPIFLILYSGVGLYIMLGVFLSSPTPTGVTAPRQIVAPAVVMDRVTGPGPRGETQYTLRLEVSPVGSESFEHSVHVDKASWETVKLGDDLLMRYEHIHEGKTLLFLGLFLPETTRSDGLQLRVEEPEETLFEEISL